MILTMAPLSFWLIWKNQRWLTEWHHYFGPSELSKKTGDPKARQPGEKSMFWKCAVWWKNQGAKVVDGIGQFKEPPKRLIMYRVENGLRILVNELGPGVVWTFDGWLDKWNGDDKNVES